MHSVGKGQKESQWPLWHKGVAGICVYGGTSSSQKVWGGQEGL